MAIIESVPEETMESEYFDIPNVYFVTIDPVTERIMDIRMIPESTPLPENTVIIDESFSRELQHTVNGYWIYTGEPKEFIKIPLSIVTEVIPHRATMRQARLALHQSGFLGNVQTYMNSASEDIKIEWEYSQWVERDNPLVTFMQSVLGLSNTQIDELFTLAASL